jgi:gas vesicle protein
MENDNSVTIFLAGLAVGAVGALLFAPATGADTRSQIKKSVGSGMDSVQDKLNDATDAAKKAANQAGSKLQDAGKRLQSV